MSLLGDVSAILERAGIAHAVIGAAALAVHGVARATSDLDLLAVDPSCLDDSLWAGLRAEGAGVQIHCGDERDPLAGVVRIGLPGQASVDLIVGRGGWQSGVLQRASSAEVGDASVPVVRAADLVLLKLYAGGPQDAWDIDQLLDVDDSIATEVEEKLVSLPEDCARLWQRIRSERVRS